MNKRGNVMIEGLVMGTFVICGLLAFLRVALLAQQSIAVDEMIEQALLCRASERSDCQEKLRQNLSNLGLRSININLSTQNPDKKWKISLLAETEFDQKIDKESELELDLISH